MTFSLRQFEERDLAAVHATCRSVEPAAWDYDVVDLGHGIRSSQRLQATLRLVAQETRSGEIVGYGCGRISPERTWSAETEVAVPKCARREAVLEALLEGLESWARDSGATRIGSWATSCDEEHHAFLLSHGYEDKMTEISSALDLTAFDPDAWLERERGGLQPDVVYVSMRDPDAPSREEVAIVTNRAFEDIPSSLEPKPASVERVMSYTMDHPYYRPELGWFARVGAEWAGVCWVTPWSASQAAQGVTAVFEPFRGRGIAWTLKLRATRVAKELGFRSLVTWNERANRGILHINERMGFRPVCETIELAKGGPPESGDAGATQTRSG